MTVVGEQNGIKARKQHRCFWCWEFIERGDLYDKWTFIDGTPEQIRTHPECHKAWLEASQDEPDGIYETGHGEHCRGCRCQSGWCQCATNAERTG